MFGMGTGGSSSLWSPRNRLRNRDLKDGALEYLTGRLLSGSSRRSESSALLVCVVNFMVKPNGQLVTVSSTHYCAYTSVLSNW